MRGRYRYPYECTKRKRNKKKKSHEIVDNAAHMETDGFRHKADSTVPTIAWTTLRYA
jgi:hypothetical protein